MCVCVYTRETQELIVNQGIMRSDGLDDFCRTFKIFTAIESVHGVESTRNEDRCSAVSVVNILNSGPSEHLEGNFKVRLKWGVENLLSEGKNWLNWAGLLASVIVIIIRGSFKMFPKSIWFWDLQNITMISFKTFPLCNCALLPGPLNVLITFLGAIFEILFSSYVAFFMMSVALE